MRCMLTVLLPGFNQRMFTSPVLDLSTFHVGHPVGCMVPNHAGYCFTASASQQDHIPYSLVTDGHLHVVLDSTTHAVAIISICQRKSSSVQKEDSRRDTGVVVDSSSLNAINSVFSNGPQH